MLRLEALSGRAGYRDIAEDTLASFAGIVEHFGLYAGSYGLALERLCSPVQVVIVGSGPEAARLEATAVARFRVNKSVFRIDPSAWFQAACPRRSPKCCSTSRPRPVPRYGRAFASATPAFRPSPTPKPC